MTTEEPAFTRIEGTQYAVLKPAFSTGIMIGILSIVFGIAKWVPRGSIPSHAWIYFVSAALWCVYMGCVSTPGRPSMVELRPDLAELQEAVAQRNNHPKSMVIAANRTAFLLATEPLLVVSDRALSWTHRQWELAFEALSLSRMNSINPITFVLCASFMTMMTLPFVGDVPGYLRVLLPLLALLLIPVGRRFGPTFAPGVGNAAVKLLKLGYKPEEIVQLYHECGRVNLRDVIASACYDTRIPVPTNRFWDDLYSGKLESR